MPRAVLGPLWRPLAPSSLLCSLLQSCPARSRGWDFLLSWFSTHQSCLSLFETPSVFLAPWQHLLLFPMQLWIYSVGCRLVFSSFVFISKVRVDPCVWTIHWIQISMFAKSNKAEVQGAADYNAWFHHLDYFGGYFFWSALCCDEWPQSFANYSLRHLCLLHWE